MILKRQYWKIWGEKFPPHKSFPSGGIFSVKITVGMLMPSGMASNHLSDVNVEMMAVIKWCKAFTFHTLGRVALDISRV